LGGVRELDAVGDGQDLEGADLAAAVATALLPGGLRDGSPWQGSQLGANDKHPDVLPSLNQARRAGVVVVLRPGQ
jgi:hypothetical protein